MARRVLSLLAATLLFGCLWGAVSGAQEPAGSEFQVNTTNPFPQQQNPDVAIDADGDFVVVWESFGSAGPDTSGWSVIGRRFNAAGQPQGQDFEVNATVQGDQRSPAVAMDSDGDFVVSFQGPDAGGGTDIFMRRYTAAGVTQGPDVQVNTFVQGEQSAPALAADSDGDFVVVWHGVQQGSAAFDIYGQRYAHPLQYPRPNGAAKVRVTLVPAHRQCTSPNSDHGPPYPASSNDACTTTGLVSDNLTVPTDDSSLHNASTTFRYRCTGGGTPPLCSGAGDQADVVINSIVSDVRCASTASAATACGSSNTSPGADYTGTLLLRLPLRITDRYNGASQSLSATLTDADFTAGLPCTGTAADPARGSSCSLNTTTDSLVPDFAREDQRALLALDQVAILDMGDNGTLAAGTIAGSGGSCPPACKGDGDEQHFLRQGIFVP